MKMTKRLIVLMLALMLTLPLAVACGDTGKGGTTTAPGEITTAPDAETTLDGYDAQGYLLDDLPAGLNFDTAVNILMWSDYTMREFHAEETGDLIDDAIWKRNNKVEERLGVKLTYVETPGNDKNKDSYIAKVTADQTSGEGAYQIYAAYSRVPPSLSLLNYTVDLLSTKYFDVEKPWWPDSLTNECTINGKLFFCSGDISTNLLWMMIATFYNKALFESYQFEKDPYALIDANEWTMEKLISMTQSVYSDTDGNSTKSDGDTYGMVVFETNIDAFQTAAGIVSVSRTSDGSIQISPEFMGERAANACELIGNFMKSEGVYHTGATSIRDIFYEERALFIMDRVFIAAGKDNAANKDKIEFKYGVIPNPKYTADQKDFSTNVGHPFTMYAISTTLKDTDCASAVLECLGSESYRLVTPAVFETAMKFKYTDDPVAARMYDIIRANVSFDIGRLYAETFSNATANIFRTTALANPTSYTTAVTRYKNIFNIGLNKVLAPYEK